MEIRKMRPDDRKDVLEMMRIFYNSDAVFTNGSDDIFHRDISACLCGSPYLEGFMLETGGQTAGYGMIARSYSTEFGKPCIWIEDIYIKDEFRGNGIASGFLKFVSENEPDSVIRLEVETENENALALYNNSGFQVIPYMEMVRLNDTE